ncbi:hypothetical protein HCN44_011089 [Aphidius gifuensis]|uniref:WD repeat-containing protein 55 homolog n=1 Tax=Aphidius gifuensis TaxID=684658 RepID=A0A834XX83_APHGI|nr:WD repeat-containing protein 55 homolog [Aphidius gifuensis]KAF7993820.1 hypothetical protein HCN44_011089 [Aphidius gifuensis]
MQSDSSDVSSDDSSSGYEDVQSKHVNIVDTVKTHDDDDDDDEEEKDELVKKIEESQILKRDHPPDIELDEPAAKVCFHPNKNIILFGTMEGNIISYNYNNESNELLSTMEMHEDSCRDLQISDDGQTFYSTSTDMSTQIVIVDFETEKWKRFYENAHDCPIYTTTIVDENLFATGDDDGCVKLWDIRENTTTPIFSVEVTKNSVNSMLTNDDKEWLVCASNSNVLTTLSLNTRQLIDSEECGKDGLLTSLGIFKNGTKLVTTNNLGGMYIFQWGKFGAHVDYFVNKNKSPINCIVPITDDTFIAGENDGVLRAYGIGPNRCRGVVGQVHGRKNTIESLDHSGDGGLIACSSSNENYVQFWNINYFEDLSDDDNNSSNKNTARKKKRGKKRRQPEKYLKSSKIQNRSAFFQDLNE